MYQYTLYNREERDLCAHLFRLLMDDQPKWRPLKYFLGVNDFSTAAAQPLEMTGPGIFCEAALIRDAYYARKPDIEDFVHDICEIIAGQNKVDDYTLFRDLPDEMKDPSRTHPRQISYKLNVTVHRFGVKRFKG